VRTEYPAYQGSEPFVFVSYAHEDADLVFQDIGYICDRGYRVWYDDGIHAGANWPDAIATAIEHCAAFVVFLSPAAVASVNTRNEINYALETKKPIVAVHLAQTPLPPGLKLRIGSTQALMRFQISTNAYYRKLEEALPAECTIEVVALVDRKRRQIRAALENVMTGNETWLIDSLLFWRTERCTLISRRGDDGYGELVPEDLETLADQLLERFRSANGPRTLARLFVRRSFRPRFEPPWYTLDPEANSGDHDATCKQCGYGEIYGGSVHIPDRCPRCHLAGV
jgi:hypothetical protein